MSCLCTTLSNLQRWWCMCTSCDHSVTTALSTMFSAAFLLRRMHTRLEKNSKQEQMRRGTRACWQNGAKEQDCGNRKIQNKAFSTASAHVQHFQGRQPPRSVTQHFVTQSMLSQRYACSVRMVLSMTRPNSVLLPLFFVWLTPCIYFNTALLEFTLKLIARVHSQTDPSARLYRGRGTISACRI